MHTASPPLCQDPTPVPPANASDPQTRLRVTTLEPVVDRIFDASLAPSTWRTYGVARSDFASFCNSIHTPPIPASEDLLIFYIAHLSLRLAHSSIRAYMSAIRNWYIVHGYTDPLTGKPKLGLFLRGVKKSKPAARDACLPITPFVLDKIRPVFLAHPSDYTNIMFWAAC